MNKQIFYRPKVNQWLLWSKMILFICLIVGSSSFWLSLETDWFNEDYDLLMLTLTIIFICWHYKIRTSWEYEKEQIKVSFYFNVFGIQEILVRENEGTSKFKFWSYRPKQLEVSEDLKLFFSKINNEIGGFGLDLRKGGIPLRPNHFK